MEKLTPEREALADRLLDLALDEDIGPGDATTRALLNPEERRFSKGTYAARGPGVMAGGWAVARLFERLGARFFGDAGAVGTELLKSDGDPFAKGDALIAVTGDAAAILGGERASLNLLQRMCAVAARTRKFVEAVSGTGAGIFDTRKTAPGQRIFDKMAVRAGGGHNHRFGLYDMILIKDNHLAVYGSPRAAVEAARRASALAVMVEVDDLGQFDDALLAGPDYILLDNMPVGAMREAVLRAKRRALENGGRRPELEASGGVSMESVRAIAESGVDRISVGSLTSAAAGVDIGLDF